MKPMGCACLSASSRQTIRNTVLFCVLLVYFVVQIAITEYQTRSEGSDSSSGGRSERTQALIAVDVALLLVSISALLLNFLSTELLSRYCVFVSSILFALLCCWLVIAAPAVARFPVFFTLNLLLELSILLMDTWSFFLSEKGPPLVPHFPTAFPTPSNNRRKNTPSGSKPQHSVDVNYGKLKTSHANSIDEGAEMVPIVSNTVGGDAVADAALASSGNAVAMGRISSLSSIGNSEVHNALSVGESKKNEDKCFPTVSTSTIGRASSISGKSGVRNRSVGSSSAEVNINHQQYVMGASLYETADGPGDTDTAVALMEQGGERSSDERMIPQRNFHHAKDLMVGYMPRDIDLTRKGMCDGFRINMHMLPACEGRKVPSDLSWNMFQNVEHVVDSSSCHIYSAKWDGEPVILKLIKAERVQSSVAVAEFDTEEHVLSRLQHPNIVRLLGSGTQPRKFLVLELLGGGTLSHSLGIGNNTIVGSTQNSGRGKRWLRKFTMAETLQLALALANALNYLHNEWSNVAHNIHRDIKPDNIGWSSDGVLKLFDFGLCASVRGQRERTEQYRLTGNTGTLRYMAPEVVLGRSYHTSVDTYSFAILIWQVAAGKIPFREMGKKNYFDKVVIGGVRPKIDSRWPSGFSELLKSCWHEDKNMRPNFGEVVAELQVLIQEEDMRSMQYSGRRVRDQLLASMKQLRPVLLVGAIGVLLLSFALSADVSSPSSSRNIDAPGLMAFFSGFLLYATGMSYLNVWPYVANKRLPIRKSLDSCDAAMQAAARDGEQQHRDISDRNEQKLGLQHRSAATTAKHPISNVEEGGDMSFNPMTAQHTDNK